MYQWVECRLTISDFQSPERWVAVAEGGMAEKVLNVMSSVADRVVHITTDSEESASPQPSRTLHHTKRGLKMVGQEKGLFDLDEPKWDDDDKVRDYENRREVLGRR